MFPVLSFKIGSIVGRFYPLGNGTAATNVQKLRENNKNFCLGSEISKTVTKLSMRVSQAHNTCRQLATTDANLL
jgi:hypothetical protein